MKSALDEWKINEFCQFPALASIAESSLALSLQSANIERSYKEEEVIHTNVRNRLHVQLVHMVLYTYINLGLNKCIDTLGDFLAEWLASAGGVQDGYF